MPKTGKIKRTAIGKGKKPTLSKQNKHPSNHNRKQVKAQSKKLKIHRHRKMGRPKGTTKEALAARPHPGRPARPVGNLHLTLGLLPPKLPPLPTSQNANPTATPTPGNTPAILPTTASQADKSQPAVQPVASAPATPGKTPAPANTPATPKAAQSGIAAPTAPAAAKSLTPAATSVPSAPATQPPASPAKPKIESQTSKPAKAAKPAAPTAANSKEPKFKPVVREAAAETGVTAKAYAAYFGDWKKITDVYKEIYAGTAKAANTGRISEVTRELLAAGLLEKMEQEARWPLYRASLEWLFAEFESKKVPLTSDDKATLQHVLFPPVESYKRVGPIFGLTKEEAAGKVPFVPTPQKIRGFLHASTTLALFLLGNPKEGVPGPSTENALLRIKRNLGIYQQIKTPALDPTGSPNAPAGAQVPPTTIAALAEGPLVESFSTFLLLKYRTALRDHENPASTMLYKLVHLLYDARSADVLWKHAETAPPV